MENIARRPFSPRFLIAVLGIFAAAGAALYAFEDKKPAVASKGDTIPDGTPAELGKFILSARDSAIEAQTKEDSEAVVRHLWTMSSAADKLLAGEPSTELRHLAVVAKFNALQSLSGLDDQAIGALRKFAQSLTADKDAAVAGESRRQLLNADLLALMTGGDENGVRQEDAKRLADTLADYLSKGRPDLGMSLQAVRTLELAPDPTVAVDLYRRLAVATERQGGPEASATAEKLNNAAYRLGLSGKRIDISGTQLNGEPLDLSDYRGKVVLIDFWATWCGPCLKELPNIKKNYELYHDQGFEVIGISVDEDRDTLEEFLKDQEISWPILFSDNPHATGTDHPMAVEMGIMAVPTVILVDQQGKVVSFDARGEKLGRRLAELLGAKKDADAS